MSESGFAVSVDLSRYFSDERSRVCVWLRAKRRVGWLAARLRRRLRLQAPPALIAPAGLLHPNDPLEVLRPYDTIRAVPAKLWFSEDENSDGECEDRSTRKAVKRVACDEVDSSLNKLEIVKRQALELLDKHAGLNEHKAVSTYHPLKPQTEELPGVNIVKGTQTADIAAEPLSSDTTELAQRGVLGQRWSPTAGGVGESGSVGGGELGSVGGEIGGGGNFEGVGGAGSPPPAHRRRRVRRRPRRKSPSSEASIVQLNGVPESPVLRNVESRPAEPRLVRELSC